MKMDKLNIYKAFLGQSIKKSNLLEKVCDELDSAISKSLPHKKTSDRLRDKIQQTLDEDNNKQFTNKIN